MRGWDRAEVGEECVFYLLFVQCPGGGTLPRTVPPIVKVLWKPGIQVPLARARADQSQVPCVAATNTRIQDIESGIIRTCKSSLPRDWCSGLQLRMNMNIAPIF